MIITLMSHVYVSVSDAKDVSDDDLSRDDSSKSRHQTPVSSTVGIDEDRESGHGDDAQIFR